MLRTTATVMYCVGSRPAAVGTQLRKITVKAITLQTREDIERAAGDRQVGLGKKGGAEAAMRTINMLAEQDKTKPMMRQ